MTHISKRPSNTLRITERNKTLALYIHITLPPPPTTFNSIINLMDLISVFLQYTSEFVKYDISDWLVQFQNLWLVTDLIALKCN